MFHNSVTNLGLKKLLLSRPATSAGVAPMTLSARENADSADITEEPNVMTLTANADLQASLDSAPVKQVNFYIKWGGKLEAMAVRWRNILEMNHGRWESYFRHQMSPISDEGNLDKQYRLSMEDLGHRLSGALGLYHRKPDHMSLEDWEKYQEEFSDESGDINWKLSTTVLDHSFFHETRPIFQEFDFV